MHVASTFHLKWLPGLKIEKPCSTFTGQTGGSTKLHWSDHQHATLCCTKWLSELKLENLIWPKQVKILHT